MSDKIQKYYREKAAEKQKEYDGLAKQDLLVRFQMATPFSSMAYLSLDGVLAYWALNALMGPDFFNIDVDPIDPINAPLPLDRAQNEDKRWWWLSSFGCYTLNGESVTGWKKRWDDQNDLLVNFPEKKKPRIDHKSGFFKAYAMPLIIRNTKEIIFCCVGNAQEIEKLLANCWHLGKKRSQGYGRIASIKIEETSENWHNWSNGRATRAIPIEETTIKEQIAAAALKNKSFALVATGYKPPYWHPRNRAYCYKIGEIVKYA